MEVSFIQHRIFCSKSDLNNLAVTYHTLSLSEGQGTSGVDVGENIPFLPSTSQCLRSGTLFLLLPRCPDGRKNTQS